VSTDTPSQIVSSFDHFVMQWMSFVTVSRGAPEPSHVQPTGFGPPAIENVHSSGGVGPAERIVVGRYCPGGTAIRRAFCARGILAR
jgi:hypothetical protein